MSNITDEQQEALTLAKKSFTEIANKFGTDTAKWAFTKKLNHEKEEAKLLKEQQKLEARLAEIKKELA